MRALVCREPGLLVEEHREPPSPAPGEALVRIRRVGICGTDYHAVRGRQPYFTYPRILGHELSGTVEQINGDPEHIRPGDAVVIIPYLECGACFACRNGRPNCCARLQVMGVHQDGGLQEYVTAPVDHLLPAGSLSLDQAAIVECLAIGAHAVNRAGVSPGTTALVCGAGPIGLGAMQAARLAGAEVIALDVNPARLRFAQEWAGAARALEAADDVPKRLEEITAGDLPSVIFECTGSAAAMQASFKYVAQGGALVFVSLVQGEICFSDPEFHRREMSLLSSRNALRADFEQVIRDLSEGRIDSESFITHRTDLSSLPSAFESWLRPESGVVKALVEM